MKLRPYQKSAIDDIRAAFASGARSTLFVLPTGGGKSVILRAIAGGAIGRGKRVMALAHRRELVGQLADKHFAEFSPGVIAAGRPENPEAAVQVASVQTLARRLDRIAPPDLLLIDEAHHAPAGQWSAVRAAWPDVPCVGVTATPCRLDGRGLDGSFDRLVLGPTAAELTDGGYLAPAEVYAPSVPDLAGVRTRGSDWSPEDLAAALEKSDIVGDAVRSFRELAPGGATAVAFAASVAHAEATAAAFNAAGIRAAVLTGKDKQADRDATLTALATGEIRVLASVDVISEGFDLPAVSAAILLRPTKSLGLYLQQVGRALRPAPGKRAAVILDHAGNALRHGLPSEDRAWSLSGGAPRRSDTEQTEDGEPLSVRQCGECYAVYPAAPKCPACGADNGAEPRIPVSRAGELRRLEAEEASRVRAEAAEARKAEERGEKTLEEWLALAKERGYKPSWAHMRHKLRQKRRAA